MTINMTDEQKELINLRVELEETKRKFRSFVSLTDDVLKIQAAYFQTRDKEVLNESKRLETKLRKEVLNFRLGEVQKDLPF